MTSELQTPRYDQIIRRVGGIIGPGSKVSEALSELFPVLDVENPPGELLFLGGWIPGHGSVSVLGSAGQSGRAQLFNPVGSGKIVIVSTALVGSANTQIIRGTVNQTALTSGVGTELSRDGRLRTSSRPVAQIRSDDTVALTDATLQFTLLANTTLRLTDPNGLAILPPGSGYEFGTSLFATIIRASFIWRERVALESELLF